LKRELYIKEIAEEFGILRNKIELLSGVNLQDINVVSEYHIQEILNVLFSYKLTGSNATRSNAIAIDLQDIQNGIAVQVTATATKAKAQKTLDGFFSSGLNAKYDMLLIVILGKKQKTYRDLKIKEGFHFDAGEHIIDLDTILRKLMTEPTLKIEKIRNILKRDRLIQSKKVDSKANFRKNLLLKKQLESLVHKNLTRKDLEQYSYMPYRKFIYDSLIVRSIDDRAFPKFDNMGPDDLVPSWYKAQIHDFYEYGIEMIPMYYEKVVINEDGKWNYLGQRDPNKLPEEIEVFTTHVVQRIPYDNMLKLEMEPEGYYGYPNLFLEYIDKRPCSEEVPTLLGYYNGPSKCRFTHYFEHRDRDESL